MVFNSKLGVYRVFLKGPVESWAKKPGNQAHDEVATPCRGATHPDFKGLAHLL